MVKRVVQEAPQEYVIEHMVKYDFFEDTLRALIQEICQNTLVNKAQASRTKLFDEYLDRFLHKHIVSVLAG
jgi:O-methyltransferase involved in polyketide biosynthesis